jgi:PAS domain S-box-containing protein
MRTLQFRGARPANDYGGINYRSVYVREQTDNVGERTDRTAKRPHLPGNAKSDFGSPTAVTEPAEHMSGVERLRHSEELYGRAFNRNPVAMSITNGATQRFVAVNDAFLTLIGFYRSDVIGRTSAELNLWPDSDSREAVARRLQEVQETPMIRAAVRNRTGTLVPCIVGYRLLDLSTGPSVLSVLVPLPPE